MCEQRMNIVENVVSNARFAGNDMNSANSSFFLFCKHGFWTLPLIINNYEIRYNEIAFFLLVQEQYILLYHTLRESFHQHANLIRKENLRRAFAEEMAKPIRQNNIWKEFCVTSFWCIDAIYILMLTCEIWFVFLYSIITPGGYLIFFN